MGRRQRYARLAIIRDDRTWKPMWVKTDGANGDEMAENAKWKVFGEMGLFSNGKLPSGIVGIAVLEVTVDPDWLEMGGMT